MDEFSMDQVIEWYEWIEKQLLDIMSVLPPSPRNLESYSPRLASLILDACGLLDSFFLQITPEDEIERIKNEKNRNPNIKDWAELFSSKFQLPMLKSIPLISPPRYIIPFEPWADLASGGNYKPLPWWQTYNNLKHDRIAHMKSAGLGVAIDSLCGLHQAIAAVPEFRKAVLRAGWINTVGVNPEMLLEYLSEPVPSRILGGNIDGCVIESQLFVVPLRIKMPENISDFRPAYCNASNRVIQFFGRW